MDPPSASGDAGIDDSAMGVLSDEIVVVILSRVDCVWLHGAMALTCHRQRAIIAAHLPQKCTDEGYLGGPCALAALRTHADCLKFVHERLGAPLNTMTWHAAAYKGRLDMCTYLRDKGCPRDASMCRGAAAGGHLALLEWARGNGYPWDHTVAEAAARHGHIDCLRYALDGGCQTGRVAESIAAQGRMDMLVWLEHWWRSSPLSPSGVPWSPAVARAAALQGRLECLRYLHEHGCPWDTRTTTVAAVYGHIECLRYAHTHGCPWNDSVTLFAFHTKHFDCLEYALDNGCPLHRNLVRYLEPAEGPSDAPLA